jgi:hypothetical protein
MVPFFVMKIFYFVSHSQKNNLPGMSRTLVCTLLLIFSLSGCKQVNNGYVEGTVNVGQTPVGFQNKTDRQIWLDHLDKLASPIIINLANDELKKNMPVVLANQEWQPEIRTKSAYLEAFGRLMSGIAPWLNLEGGSPEELALRNKYRPLVLKAIANAVNPAAKDYMEWENGNQRLVDASYLAMAFLRCPWLWNNLPDVTKKQVVTALTKTRNVNPVVNNWILMSGLIEVFMYHYGYQYDEMRIDFVLREFDQWYAGDGMYSDGPSFHTDYYNSFVIHPFLTRIIEEMYNKKEAARGNVEKLKSDIKGEKSIYEVMNEKLKVRNDRYSVILERMINTDGTYTIIGRSLVYRGGAFHHLSDMALRKQLPAQLSPAQVRCALTAVIKKTTENPNTFNSAGWLNIGIYGSQPALGDIYITTGSLYMCANILIALGLPDTDEFWAAPAQLYTSQKIWKGENGPADQHLEEE